MDFISAFLFDRDKRVAYQEDLLKKNKDKTLVTIRINYPGIEKSNYITDDIVNIIYNDILTYYGKFIVFEDKYKNKEVLFFRIKYNTKYKSINHHKA